MRRFCTPDGKSGITGVRILGLFAAVGLVAALIGQTHVIAGIGGLGNNNAVGGVVVDATGMVRSATLAERSELLTELKNRVAQPHGDMADGTELRMVSLKKLQAALENALATGDEIPAEMQVMAGLQRIEYVFVYPERNDIVLAGPAESWVVREDASVVGSTTGRPVLLLSDLVTAFRSVEPSRDGGITCSIEPTAEGRMRLNRMLSRIRLTPGQNPRQLEPMMREAFGPQQVKLSGIPTDSHYARVLLAADYQMKRIAMALEPAPVQGLPSYLEMSRNQKQSGNQNPRWWMACNYDALKHDETRLAWKLSGQGVKTLTDQDVMSEAGGQVAGGGKRNVMAEKWADLMTEKFNELAVAQSVFGDLRNIMDLSVVATLVVQEGLDAKAGCDLSTLMGGTVEIPMVSYPAPRAVEPQCSFVRGASGWTVTASGGVEVTAFDVVANQETDAALAGVHQRAAETEADRWWWNG